MGYSIGKVSELTGIPRNTLLAWERRYELVEPQRADNGYRVYSEADVETLRRVNALVKKGHRISHAVNLVNEDPLGEARERASTSRSEVALEIQRALEDRLLHFDRAGAEKVLVRTVLMSFPAAVDDIYLPLMREIGNKWHLGEVSVAQEHFATNFCREKLITMLVALSHGIGNAREVICAGPQGETHELGLLAISIKLALHGFHVTYLGADLPVEDLIEVCQEREPELLCMSAVLQRDDTHLPDVIRTVRAGLPRGTTLAVGGPAMRQGLPVDLPGVLVCETIEDLLEQLPSR